MASPPDICEACEKAPAADVGAAYRPSSRSYRLCTDCHRRLHDFALRPIEWYNLAKRYGIDEYWLHDDFYDDNGDAAQPAAPVESPHLHRAPTLAERSSDPASLFEYTSTRWHISDLMVAAWRHLPIDEVLSELERRYANPELRDVTIRIAAILKENASDLVRRAWRDFPDSMSLFILSNASVACLPLEEGYRRVCDALDQLDARTQRDEMYCLGDFHDRRTLDWIEGHFFEPVTESWGRLAAVSQLDWKRASAWLQAGRPWSLIALDALYFIAIRDSAAVGRAVYTPLQAPPNAASLIAALITCAKRDDVPRVRSRVDHLTTNVQMLIGNG